MLLDTDAEAYFVAICEIDSTAQKPSEAVKELAWEKPPAPHLVKAPRCAQIFVGTLWPLDGPTQKQIEKIVESEFRGAEIDLLQPRIRPWGKTTLIQPHRAFISHYLKRGFLVPRDATRFQRIGYIREQIATRIDAIP